MEEWSQQPVLAALFMFHGWFHAAFHQKGSVKVDESLKLQVLLKVGGVIQAFAVIPNWSFSSNFQVSPLRRVF